MYSFEIDPMLSAVAENLSLAWAYVDSDLNYQKVSTKYATSLKLQIEEIEGQPVIQVLGETVTRQLSPYLVRVLKGEEICLDEKVVLNLKTGSLFRDATYLPRVNSDGTVEGFFVFMRDATENNKAIETLRKLHLITANNQPSTTEKIQQILKLGKETFNLPLAIVSHIVDEKYLVQYFDTPNNEVKPFDGFALGETYCIHTLNANGPIGFDHVEKSTIKNHPCYKAFGLESYIGIPLFVSGSRYGTLNFSGPDIHTTPFSENDYELIRLFSQWIGNELTNHIVSEDLARQKMLLESMSQLARIGAWELDLEKDTLYWSSMTKEIHEVPNTFEPNVTTAINFYKEGQSRDNISKAVQLSLEEGIPWNEELQIVTAKGNVIWVAALGQAEFKHGKCVRLFGSFQDIDSKVKADLELKEAKNKAEQAAKSKSDFLANMSHEIRTPMNGVRGMLSALDAEELSSEAASKIAIVKSSTESLLSLINGILDFSKIDAGHLELDNHDIDLKQLFIDFADSMRYSTNAKGLNLKLELDEIIDGRVNADSGRIKQVLNNLVSNAIKFTHQGSITIKASLLVQNDRRILNFTIIDTGIGIPTEKLKSLFNPFTQADSSTTRKYGGTGLGLAIVKQLCQLMKGNVWAESLEGHGSTFRISLNLNAPERLIPLPEIEKKEVGTKLNTRTRLLLVEDNTINQLVAQELLKQLGFTTEVAVNGAVAIKKMNEAKHPFDLIFMDCQMPEMDGYEATKRIRKGEAGNQHKHIKIIALTANAMKGDKEKCINAGMNDYLKKPFIREDLKHKLGQHVAVNSLNQHH
ncbi:MAG: PAS domain S-box-containing protein [Oleiphilaceae bacterium]|jgi:PAS domain S-box-containing protein